MIQPLWKTKNSEEKLKSEEKEIEEKLNK